MHERTLTGLSLDIAWEQALRGALAVRREKDGEPATTSMRNTYWRRWHLVMMSLPLARVFQCLFIYAVVSALRWMAEIWQISRRGATGELEMEFKLQRRRALSIYQTLWETSMERSIERRTCEFDTSSIRWNGLVTKIQDGGTDIAVNSLELLIPFKNS